jgi:hypothetical protein
VVQAHPADLAREFDLSEPAGASEVAMGGPAEGQIGCAEFAAEGAFLIDDSDLDLGLVAGQLRFEEVVSFGAEDAGRASVQEPHALLAVEEQCFEGE